LIRSACACAAWCFHSFGHACLRARYSGSSHSGVPSRRTGSGVEAVKSVPMPMTVAASTPAASIAAGTAERSTSRQSSGSCSAHAGGSRSPVSGSVRSITALRYSDTAEPSSAPSSTRTTTARPESVPKSTPTT
jgi:hypothetical protein